MLSYNDKILVYFRSTGVQQSPINATQNQRGPRGAGSSGGGRVSRPVGGPEGQHGVHGHAGQKRPRPGRWKQRRRRDFRSCRHGQADHGVPAPDVRRRQQARGVRRWFGGGLQAGQHGFHGHAWQEGLLQQGLGGRVLRHARQEGSVRGRVLRRPRQEVAGPRGRRRRGRPIVPDIYPVQDHRRTEVGTLGPG